jgi:hypothetical protein
MREAGVHVDPGLSVTACGEGCGDGALSTRLRQRRWQGCAASGGPRPGGDRDGLRGGTGAARAGRHGGALRRGLPLPRGVGSAASTPLKAVEGDEVRRVWGAKNRSGFGTRRSSALPRSIVACSTGDPWTARKRRFRAASRGSDTRRQRPRSNKGTPHAWQRVARTNLWPGIAANPPQCRAGRFSR